MSYYALKRPDLSVKANAQEAHALRRSVQRLGKPIDVKEVASKIRRGESIFLEKENHRKTHHLVQVDEEWVHIVYDKTRQVVITILPRD